MFKQTLYILSDGTKTKDRPYYFSERDEMVDEAKEIAKSLKWTKKLKGDDFFDVWLNNEDVKKYRQLLKKIWNFAQDLYIVEEKECCEKDGCLNTENLVICERLPKFYRNPIPDRFIYCESCANDAMEFWSGGSGKFEVRILPKR